DQIELGLPALAEEDLAGAGDGDFGPVHLDRDALGHVQTTFRDRIIRPCRGDWSRPLVAVRVTRSAGGAPHRAWLPGPPVSGRRYVAPRRRTGSRLLRAGPGDSPVPP